MPHNQPNQHDGRKITIIEKATDQDAMLALFLALGPNLTGVVAELASSVAQSGVLDSFLSSEMQQRALGVQPIQVAVYPNPAGAHLPPSSVVFDSPEHHSLVAAGYVLISDTYGPCLFKAPTQSFYTDGPDGHDDGNVGGLTGDTDLS